MAGASGKRPTIGYGVLDRFSFGRLEHVHNEFWDPRRWAWWRSTYAKLTGPSLVLFRLPQNSV